MAQLFNQTIKKAPDGKLHDGRGLMLVKKGAGAPTTSISGAP